MALPLLIPWNVVGTIWQVFGRCRYRAARLLRHQRSASNTTMSRQIRSMPGSPLVIMDVWHWTSLVVLLCYAGLVSIPDAYYQAAKDRRREALGGVPLHPAAEDEARAD
jgi:glycerol transport system permease protein